MLFSPIDPLLAVLYAAYKLRHFRGLILLLGLLPAGMYALPAQPCGCIRVPFQRCSSYGRESAYRAAMKSDLKNLASQEEIYFSDEGRFTASASDMGFVSSSGVRVTVVSTADGWAARATHEALGAEVSCGIRAGAEVPHRFDVLEDADIGELVCTF